MLTYLTSHLPPLITTVHLLPFLIHLPTLVSCVHTRSTNPTLPNTNTSAVSGFQDLLTTHPPLARSLTIANPASNLLSRDVHTDLNNYVSTVFPNGWASRFYLTPPTKHWQFSWSCIFRYLPIPGVWQLIPVAWVTDTTVLCSLT